MLNNQTILVTGGTGSFGKKFIKTVFARYSPEKVIVYSRDELKQYDMHNSEDYKPYLEKMRFFIGDVRDLPRLKLAMNSGVDIVLHHVLISPNPCHIIHIIARSPMGLTGRSHARRGKKENGTGKKKIVFELKE